MKKAKSFDELSSVGSLGTDGDTIGVLRTGTKDRANQIDDEELQSGPGLEAGLFGVLYTLKKDPVVCGWLASMVRLLLDPLQQLAVMLNPAFGWYAWMDWPGLGWIWAGLSYLDFARKIGQNAPYGVYEGVLYAFGALLLAVLGACVYIGVRLRRNHLMQMKNTWIVWLTTHVITLLLQTLFVANMGIPLLSMYCHWLVPASSGGDSTGSDAASSNSTTTNTTTGSSNTTVGLLNVTVAIANATLTNSSMSLNTTQTDAAASEPAYRRGYLNYYQDRSCSAFPQVLDLVLGVLIAVLYGLMTTLFTVADVDTNPLTDRLLAVVNPRVELFNLAAKTLFLLAGNVIVTDVQQLQALIFALCMAAQTFTVFRWLPHTIRITNYLRAGFKLGLTWVAILMVVLRFTQEKGDLTGDGTARITAIMLIGLPCAVVVGCLLARYRQHRWFYRGMRRFRNTLDTEHPKDVYKFWDIYEVEMLSRVCRTPGDVRGTQDSRMLKYADRIIRAGIALFPTSAYAHILYANFLIEVQSLYQAGQSQLMAARKLTPNFLERYALFMRQQQHMQRAHTSTTGESAVDLVTYVEFQRNYRLLLRATTRALLAQQSFWKLLQHSTLQFNALTSAFRNIEAAQEAALKTYRSVLERYPNSVKLLRSYAHFQEEVMNNPWRAAQIYEKADKLEEQQAAAQDYLLYANDSSMLTQVDDRNNAVAVINSSGIIQMTNKPLQQLFGYKASELEGQNVSILMPAPYCNRHNGYIAAYVSTGQARVVDTVREVVALHRRRHVFPIKLAVSKLSGQGADSQFLGVIRLVEVNTKVVRAYVMHNGITLCVEDRFEDIFGVSPAECIGRPFKDLVVEQDEAQSLMNSVREAGAPTSYGRAAGAGVTVRLHLQHKYAAPVLVDVSITAGGTPDEPLHVFSLAPIGGQAGGTSAGGAGSVPPALVSVPASAMVSTTALMVFNRGGNVVFASSSASAMLGYAHKSFLLMNLEALLPEHIKSLHAIGMRELMARKAAHSCRSGQTVFMAASNKALVPVRLSISHKAEGDDNLLTVVEAVRSSVDAGLDERRVKLEVGPTGEVLAVLSPASPVSLLGVAPVALVGSNLFKLVPELGKAAPTEQVQEEAVEELRVLCMKRMAPAYLRVVLGGGNAASPDGAGPGPVGGGGATAAGGTAPTAAAAANAASAATMAPAHAGVRLQASEQLAAIPEASEAAAGTARAAGPAAAGLSGVLLTEDDNEEALLQAAATAAATIHTYKPARQLPMSPAAARAAAAQQAAVRTADLPLSVPTAAAMPPPFLTGEAAGVLQPGFGPSARGRDVGRRHQGTGVLGLLPHAVILEIDGTSGDANLVVSIWHPDKVASVLEVSREGDIRQAVLDELHPPGPLFGVGPTQLLQHNMKDLLGLSPRQSLLQYFYTSGNAVFSRGSASSLAQQAQQLQQAEGASAGPQGRRGPIDGSDVSSGGGAGNGEGAPGTSAAQRPSLLNPPTSSALRGGTEAKGVTIAAGGSTAAGGPSGAASNSGASLLSRRLPSPIVHVTVTHADGRPLHVLAQALPRRTSSHTFYVRLHLMPNAAHVQLGGTALVPAGLAGAAGGADAAAVASAYDNASSSAGCSKRSSDEDAAARGDDRRRSAAPHSQGSLHPNRSAHGSGSANRTSGPGVAEAAASPGGAAATGAATASPVAFATGEGGPLSSHSLNGSEEPDPYDDITDPSEHDSDGEARASAFDSLGPAVDEARARRGHGEGDGSDSGDSTVRALRDTVVAPLAEIGRRTMRRGLDTSTSGIAIGGESAHAAEHRADEHDPADIHTEQAAAAPMSLEHPHPHSAEALGAAGVGPVFLREHAAAERQDQAAATAGGLGHQSLQPGLHSLYLQPPSGPAASLAQPASSGHAPSNHERPAVGSGPVSAAAAGAAAATCAASLGGRSRVPEHPTDRLRVAPSAGSVARLSEVALKRLARAAEADAAAAGKHSPRSVRNRDQLGTRAGGDGLSGVDAAARSSLTRRWIQSAGAAGPGRSSPDGVHGIAGVFGSPRGSGADFAAAGDDVRARSGLLEPAALPLNSPPGAGEPGRRGGISSGAPGYPGHVGRGAASVIPGPGTGAEGAPVEWGETTPAEDTDGQGQCRRLADPLQPPALLQQASSRRLTRRNTAANATAAAASGSAGGGFSSPPASEGASDDRSSSYSGAPGRGATEAEDEERHLDFQRGKRLRRIQKILERPESRKPIARFWRQSRIISVLLFLSHLACFVGIMVLLGDLKSCVSDIAASGLALEEVHSAALASRVLDLMHKNRTQDKLYRIEDMGTYERMMQTSVQGFEDRFVPAYRNFAAKHPQHLRKLARLWDDRVYPVDVQLAATASRSEATYVQQYMSLFEMGSWFQAYATEVAGNHNYTVQDIGYNLSDTRGFQFIHNAAVLDLVDAYIKVLDTNVEDCVDAAALTNDVMLSLLIVEACFICGCTAIYIMWRLMQVTKWRCALFGVFMSVPNPSIKALASRKISEDYDEDNSLVEGQAAGDGAQVTSQDRQPDTKAQAADADGVSKRVLGLAEQSGEAGGGSGDTRSRRAGGPGSPLEGSGGGGGAVPPGAEPPVGAAARSNWASPGPSRLRASFRDFAPPGVGLESDRGEGGDGKAGAGAGAIGRDTSASPTGLQGTKQAGAAGLPRGALVGAGTATKGPAPSSLQPSWRQRFNAWRDSVVRFFRTQYTRPGSRKVLAYNSVRNWWLCLPVVIWAILIITLYAVSYTLVTDLYEPIETVNIASFVVMRNTRLVYFAHEMCTLSDPALIPSYRRSLSDRRVIAGVEYDVLLYGDKYYNPAMLVNMSNGVHRIGKSSGIISSTSRIQQLLFFTQECLRSDQSTCLNRRSPLFQVTHSGVNALVTALFQTCDLLLDAPDAQINQNSIYLAAMFQIGLNDARDGLLTVQSHYIDSINNRIMRIAGLQIGLMAALLPLLIVFVFYLVRPFVKHIKEECNRMAIMLSELPQDADVVRMVEDAVGLGRAAAEARRKAKEAKRQARKAAALASKTIDAKKRPGLVRLPTGSFKY
ncbi:hypothetical protein HYH02_005593 [Chlamydomonas schloesseri]|uniref:PAS domain-containing protein n=1 Tax=Chlamydomonas schloesseri TaxID=2026947 RepID=A0A835WM00_9CHLO|nr:hypothetical protein HYH02_005593 [Chlamydomonas schloesseri]|eukprot:KAG2449446.1 hypothetical protein HYH02_005593 [Chlamydomonas schloesseri]